MGVGCPCPPVRKNFVTPRHLLSSYRFVHQFLVADTQLYKRLRPSVRPSITIESKSGKTRISAPAHPSATGGRVSVLYSTYPSFQFSLSIGEAIDVRTEPESMLTPKQEFSLQRYTDDLPVENAIVPWDLCRSISTSTSTDKSEIQEVKLSKTVASPLQPQSLDEERHIR